MDARDRAAPEERLGRSAASGVLWVAAQNWLVRASGFVTLLVLTHQVSPSAFGVVAAAMTIIPMVQLLSDLGFSTYLLQTEEVDDTVLSTAFWASVTAGVVFSLALVASAPVLADAFDSPGLEPVLRSLVAALVPGIARADAVPACGPLEHREGRPHDNDCRFGPACLCSAPGVAPSQDAPRSPVGVTATI